MIAVSNRHLCKRPFLEQIKIVCEWHPKALILREKDLTEAEYEQLAGQVMKICETYKVPCILHNFWQIAVKLNCNQIHLPLPVLRQLVNQAVIQEKNQGSGTFYQIGTSVHSVEEAVEAEKLGASCSVPLMCAPVKIGGKAYLDGSIVDSIPYERAFERGCDKVVVVQTRKAGEFSLLMNWK